MFNYVEVAPHRIVKLPDREEPVRTLRDLQRPALGQIEQSFPVPIRRQGQKQTSGLKNPRRLGQHLIKIGNMFQYVDRVDAVELGISKRKLLADCYNTMGSGSPWGASAACCGSSRRRQPSCSQATQADRCCPRPVQATWTFPS